MFRYSLVLLSLVLGSASSFSQELEEPPRVPFFAPKKWALCIGTQNYTALSPLKYAAKDAVDFGQALQTDLGFEKSSVKVLADTGGQAAATANNVNAAIDELLANRTLDRGDLFILYFSGHGIGLADGDYWMLNDADPKNPQAGGIRIESVLGKLVAKKLRNVVVISDACRAGEKNTFGSRLISLGRKSNIAVLLGCAPGAKSYESPKLGHGVFTNYLLKNLKNDALLDKETGALRMSALGKRIATSVEGFTRPDYGNNAQKPLVLADQDQDVILASFPPKDTSENIILNSIQQQLKAKSLSMEDAQASLFLAGLEFESTGKPDQALKLYRQLYGMGEARPNFLLHFVTSLLAQGRSAEANRVLGQVLDNPEPSIWIDLLSVFGPRDVVPPARLANAASSLFNSEYRDQILDAIDLTLEERGMTYERSVQWTRMEKLQGTIWPAYASLARRASTGEDVDLKSFLALNPTPSQADIASRLTYSGLLKSLKFDECAALVESRLAIEPGNGFWGLKRLVLATIRRDPKRNEIIAEQLKRCTGGKFALGCTFLLGPESKLFASQLAETAARLPNSFEAQVAAWVALAMQDLTKLAPVPESLRKLAPTEYEEFSVPMLALSDAMQRISDVVKPDPKQVQFMNYQFAMSLEEDWRGKKMEMADTLVDVYRLLSRSDDQWRISLSYLNLTEEQCDAVSTNRKKEFYEIVFLAMLNNGFMAPAESAYARLAESGKVSAYLQLRYALARLQTGYVDGAKDMVERARLSKPFGKELTLARLIDVHLAILEKNQQRVNELLDAIPKDSQFSQDLLMYSHYLALLNNSQVILTEEATKDILTGSSEFHDVWSSMLKLGLTRLAPDPAKLGGNALAQLMQAVVEEPYNNWFETTGYPGDQSYEGGYSFSGLLVTPQQSAEGVLRFKVDSESRLEGTIEIPSDKSVFKLTGEVDSHGRFTGSLEFEEGKSADIYAALLPSKVISELPVQSIPALKFIVNSASPAGVMFIVTGRPKTSGL